MIDYLGALRCNGCRKKLGANLNGQVEIVCPKCNRFNKFDTSELKFYTLTAEGEVVTVAKI